MNLVIVKKKNGTIILADDGSGEEVSNIRVGNVSVHYSTYNKKTTLTIGATIIDGEIIDES